jgi:nucleoside-diphosphate-sugar epimerase
MRILVTGSAGHLGEALMRTLGESGHERVGVDVLASPYTDLQGSIVDRDFVRGAMRGVDAVLHAATLHKPHVATHRRQDFIDVNLTGTLNLLEAAADAKVGAFVFTSTTSAFGRALTPPPGEPAAWLTEEVVPVPKNIYGVTKVAAENLCELAHRDTGMPCLVLRTSRFFPEEDDQPHVRDAREDANNKANEFLYRRVDIEDVVDAHLLALAKARDIGFARYIISATTPFTYEDVQDLRTDAASVVNRRVPGYEDVYASRGWSMFPGIDRVYVNERARREIGWVPKYDFARVIDLIRAGQEPRSPLARAVGAKGYHPQVFADEPYPVE